MLAIISILPLDGTKNIKVPISKAIAVIAKSGYDYRLTAMGSIVECSWPDLVQLLGRIRSRVLASSKRIYLTVSIDEKRKESKRLISKTKSIEKLLGRTLKI